MVIKRSFTKEEMIELFSLTDVSRSASAFNHDKLIWMNHHYICELPRETVAKHLVWHMQNQNIDTSNGPELSEIVGMLSERSKTLKEMAAASRYFYEEFNEYDANADKKHFKAGAIQPLKTVLNKLSALENWDATSIHTAIQDTATDLEIGMGKVGMPLRVAATGNGQSPSLDITLAGIGRDRSLTRIAKAISYLEQKFA